jgi:hypothetical protein
MPRNPEKCRLLHGPYRAPSLKRGDRADCHLRGTAKITSWTSARIAWPRCLPLNSKGHPALLLDDELARAVRTEAAAAVCYWWGVSHGAVERWRKALDVTRTNNPRTHELMLEASRAGAEGIKAREWTDEERDAKRRLAKRLKLARHIKPGYHGPLWTAEQKQLLGTLPDVARRTGRSENAVRIMREKMGLPNPESSAWTAEELAQPGTATDAKVADRIGRTPSVSHRSGLPSASGRRGGQRDEAVGSGAEVAAARRRALSEGSHDEPRQAESVCRLDGVRLP